MTTDTKAADEAGIRATMDAWSRALAAKDAKRVVSHYAPNVVQYSLAPPLGSTGADAKELEAWFSTWKGPIGSEARDLRITAAGGIGFCHGLVRMTGTKTDGQAVELWFRQTLCFRKIGADWKIVHEHESVPFYMDGSLKAAVDLRP